MSTATGEKLLGCETPRIFTPPRRELTPETTHGFACIAFAEQVLGFTLFPWQRWLLLHALELNEDGTYRFRYVIVLVGRQNGKSLMLLILALWHIYALDSQMVIGTAQDLARADKAWEEAVDFAQSDEELADLIERVDKGHPKILRLAKTEEAPWFREYRVASAGRRGGRGFSADLILLDELREHQSWDSWAAVTNAMNARPNGQAWAFSNAGDVLSVVLRYLRAQAHRDLGWPDGDADSDVLEELDAEMEDYLAEIGEDASVTGFFEWSAPPDAKRTDRGAWAQANPSMNHTSVVANCVTERTIAAALAGNPPYQFFIEVLCRWITMADAGPFEEGSWVDTVDARARPASGARSVVCVDLSWNRAKWSIARAAADPEGDPVCGIVESRQGVDWMIPWLKEHRADYEAIVLQTSTGTPAASLLDALEAEELPVVKWAGSDLSAATGQAFDMLRDRRVKHLPHPGLDMAATSAAVKIMPGGGFVIDRAKSPTDAAPLIAWIGAVWGLGQLEEPKKVEVWGFLS